MPRLVGVRLVGNNLTGDQVAGGGSEQWSSSRGWIRSKQRGEGDGGAGRVFDGGGGLRREVEERYVMSCGFY
ncbi:hypothetical protein Droror1_Dr00020026 [Drosera rotundifolia]